MSEHYERLRLSVDRGYLTTYDLAAGRWAIDEIERARAKRAVKKTKE